MKGVRAAVPMPRGWWVVPRVRLLGSGCHLGLIGALGRLDPKLGLLLSPNAPEVSPHLSMGSTHLISPWRYHIIISLFLYGDRQLGGFWWSIRLILSTCQILQQCTIKDNIRFYAPDRTN